MTNNELKTILNTKDIVKFGYTSNTKDAAKLSNNNEGTIVFAAGSNDSKGSIYLNGIPYGTGGSNNSTPETTADFSATVAVGGITEKDNLSGMKAVDILKKMLVVEYVPTYISATLTTTSISKFVGENFPSKNEIIGKVTFNGPKVQYAEGKQISAESVAVNTSGSYSFGKTITSAGTTNVAVEGTWNDGSASITPSQKILVKHGDKLAYGKMENVKAEDVSGTSNIWNTVMKEITAEGAKAYVIKLSQSNGDHGKKTGTVTVNAYHRFKYFAADVASIDSFTISGDTITFHSNETSGTATINNLNYDAAVVPSEKKLFELNNGNTDAYWYFLIPTAAKSGKWYALNTTAAGNAVNTDISRGWELTKQTTIDANQTTIAVANDVYTLYRFPKEKSTSIKIGLK